MSERRLINANVALEEIFKAQSTLISNDDNTWEKNKKYYKGLALANRIIMDTPTIDAVEVTRCKDCEHSEEHDCPNLDESLRYCLRFDTLVSINGFCHKGTKKDMEV